ncbi:MAG: hypothetical protein AAB588_01240 [Patescibacteria group bacterium]
MSRVIDRLGALVENHPKTSIPVAATTLAIAAGVADQALEMVFPGSGDVRRTSLAVVAAIFVPEIMGWVGNRAFPIRER